MCPIVSSSCVRVPDTEFLSPLTGDLESVFCFKILPKMWVFFLTAANETEARSKFTKYLSLMDPAFLS